MATARSSPCWALMRCASSSRSICLRLESTTVAPRAASSSATADPMPRLAPVTMATRPLNSDSDIAARINRPMELVSSKTADDILERIFQPSTKPSALDQAEETLRHPKKLVYIAMSNKSFYWRGHIQKFVLDSGMVPISPYMLFDYYLMHTVDKDVVREPMNNLLSPSDEVWVVGRLAPGVNG